MPWGLVLPAARAKLADADCEPDVRLSTIHSVETLLGFRVIPVGLALAASMVQLPSSDPLRLYLKTLSVVLSLTTHREVPSVTRSLGLLLLPLRAKLLAAFWLPDRRLAAPVYL